MAGTNIEWATDVWNPTTGCDRVSPGCANCYALTLAKRLKAMGQARYQRDGDPCTSGPGFGLTVHHDSLDLPLRWRKPRLVFVNSMSDLFHDEVPAEFVYAVFRVMGEASRHTFQVLTKRPERARDLFADVARCEHGWLTHNGDNPTSYGGTGIVLPETWPLPNVWMGVSIENARFTYRADVLREIPAAVRFISAEPLLGSLYNVGREHAVIEGMTGTLKGRFPLDLSGIDWVIIGGESGPGARSFHLEHAREIIGAAFDACESPLSDRHPAIFVKQLGAKPVLDVKTDPHAFTTNEVPLTLRDRKGGDMDEWPADLRIREFPRTAVTA